MHHGEDDQGGNPHAHLQLVTRKVDGDGFGQKERSLDSKTFLKWVRDGWAELANGALGKAGSSARIDPRSLKAQGIEREPQTHLGLRRSPRQRGRERNPSLEPSKLIIGDHERSSRHGHRNLNPDHARSESRNMASTYEELVEAQREIDELTNRKPQSADESRERDQRRATLEAKRDQLVRTLDRGELEQGRGIGEDEQKRLLAAWDRENRPVPDQDGRPVDPRAQNARSDRDRSSRESSRTDWTRLSPEERREEIRHRTRLDELKAEMAEIDAEFDLVRSARRPDDWKDSRLQTLTEKREALVHERSTLIGRDVQAGQAEQARRGNQREAVDDLRAGDMDRRPGPDDLR